MPSKLRNDAWCPLCGRDLDFVIRVTNTDRTRLQLSHVEDKYDEDSCLLQGSAKDMDRVFDRLNQ